MWKKVKLGDVIAVIQNGINCKQDKSGNGEKITRIETIADSTINYSKTGFSFLDEKQKERSRLLKGDILFSHINSPIHVGKTALYDGTEPLYHGINLLRLVTNEAVESRYFNFFLNSIFYNGYWKKTAKQSVNQASVNQNDIKRVPFSYPPLSEQRRIVAKLDGAFAQIDQCVGLAAAQEADLYKLKARLLTESFSPSPSPSPSLSKKVKLKNIATIFTDGNWIETKNQSENGIRLLQTGNIRIGSFANRIEKARYISESTFKNLNCNEVKTGDILVSRLPDPVGRACIIPQLDYKAITAVDCTIIRVSADISCEYLNFYMQSEAYFSAVRTKVTGATRQRISRKNLGEITLQIPPLSQQHRIVGKLDGAFSEIEKATNALSQSQQNYHALKSALLNQELHPSEAA